MSFRAPKTSTQRIVDTATGTTYEVGSFLGKEAFGRCHKLKDVTTGYVYACKMVPKSFIANKYLKTSLYEEINLVKSLNHKHVLGYYSHFFKPQFLYILLELCINRSLNELLTRRKVLTEPEVCYFVRQISCGVQYLHQNRVVHRDLKPLNIFLDYKMHVKIGNFNVSLKLGKYMDKALVGTPTYMAPEMINNTGHSFEVDIWAIGCITYILLIGHGPFEANSLTEIYDRILNCSYDLPNSSFASRGALRFIKNTLQVNPQSRPRACQLLSTEFLSTGLVLTELPPSCLLERPHFESFSNTSLRTTASVYAECSKSVQSLQKQLKQLLVTKPGSRGSLEYGEESTSPAANPIVWVTKWCSLTQDHSFAYRLCDGSIGCLFNDQTKLLMMEDQYSIHYISKCGEEAYYKFNNYPPTLIKKMMKFNYVRSLLVSNTQMYVCDESLLDNSVLTRVPHMYQWRGTSSVTMMILTSGIVQIEFKNYAKMVLCPSMEAVTLLFDGGCDLYTYRFRDMMKEGCSRILETALKAAYHKLCTM